MRYLSLLCCLLVFAVVLAEKKSYKGYKVLRVEVDDEDQGKVIKHFEDIGFDFWTDVRVGGTVDIMVPPTKSGFANLLRELGFRYSTMIEDVQTLIDAQPMSSKQARLDFESYHPLENIYEFWDELTAMHEHVSWESIGESYEGRDMRVLKICRGGCGNKPAMWIQAGIHAREWISPAVATYLAEHLTTSLTPANEDLVENIDWYILPSVNPDGYQHSQDEERLWRKTRRPNGGTLNCVGTDANRNYGYEWNTGGSDANACSDTYHGGAPFSEVENQNIRDYILARPGQFAFFHDMHSYSQLILLPWGFTTSPAPGNTQLTNMANTANAALFAVHGMRYEVGCIPCLLYVASGGACDWAKGTAGIDYSLSMELRDTGNFGFLLPANQIIPTGEEVFAFHASMARQVFVEKSNKA